ncbi:MAG: NAD-binding protein [Methanocellales archaeon]|nr:NAD-binding protein [Methanocellales archaeon]MDD3290954.1 NAD-binding protein [Methanocellales archaeon]MDD5234839.1 NAD-binding protein [Methanocellales archaeon]MDD5484791.1 NAD-binding protein [Methanocellales archaeon]
MYAIIVGCGKIGSRLAQLLSSNENNVVVLDRDLTKFEEIDKSFDGLTIEGDGTDQDVLKKAGVDKADVFIATTEDDNTNLMACQIAKQVFNVSRVIARVNDPKREPLFKELKIDAIVCPTTIAAAHLRNAVMYPNLATILTVNGGNIEISEIRVQGSASGKALKDLNLPKESTIAAIIRDRKTLIPSGDTIIQEGDVAVVVNLAAISDEVRNILSR